MHFCWGLLSFFVEIFQSFYLWINPSVLNHYQLLQKDITSSNGRANDEDSDQTVPSGTYHICLANTISLQSLQIIV